MEAFQKHRGKLAFLDRSHVDTDQIIPKQFLKKIDRVGYGQYLFFDWRFLTNGRPNPDFALNAARYKEASILVTRSNFGCGSSREHAVWALQQYGFRVVIAQKSDHIPAFADIFRNNSMKNGLVTVALSDAEVNQLFELSGKQKTTEMTVDLPSQTLLLHDSEGDQTFSFEFPAAEKERLIKGLDDVALTLQFEAEITAYERS